MARGSVIVFSHGGGPLPVLGDPSHKDIIKSFKTRVPKILKMGTPDAPRAIVLVTAHWSTADPTISAGSAPELYYDYGGFPAKAYELKYPAPGSPEVAQQVKKAMESEGLKPVLDEKRGWDHGVFIPMLLVNPSANIPIVQVSVLSSEDPASHFAMGRALSTLRDANIAVIGSGFASFHNLPAMMGLMGGGGAPPDVKSRLGEWSRALTDAVLEPGLEERERRLSAWRKFPHSYFVHPARRAEHFLPLLVAAGAAGNQSGSSYKDDWAGVDVWSYYWE